MHNNNNKITTDVSSSSTGIKSVLHYFRWLSIVVVGMTSFLTGCDELKRINELPIAKGHAAKQLCSFTFNSGLDPVFVKWRFIAPDVSIFPLIWKTEVDREQQQITVGDVVFLNESLKAKTVYREGMGCTVLVDKSREELLSSAILPTDPPALDPDQPWPHGTNGETPEVISGLDYDQLNGALEKAFAEDRDVKKNTTSLLVAYDGKLIAEKYALGVTADSPVIGWSMTKSLTSTLMGILVDQGRVDINQSAPIPGWQFTEKSSITIANLMHMSSGLDYAEGNNKLSNSTQMLYLESDQSGYMSSLDLIHEPGTTFNYSTGETNLLAKIIQDSVGGTAQDAYSFYQNELFYRIGIRSALIEFDESGQFIGGAYGFMTPRDWLRMGQLYLQRGQWQGEQVISEAWVNYVTTPSAVNPVYGGQMWLNTNGKYFEGFNIPEDTYLFAGHQGQMVVIVPSENLVVVRTGVYNSLDNVIVAEVIESVIDALP